MKIKVTEIPNCTWELEDTSFYCTHDEFEVVDYVEDHLGFQGHYQTEHKGYQCADPDCEEPIDGSPEEDAYDPDFEYEQFRDSEYERLREY